MSRRKVSYTYLSPQLLLISSCRWHATCCTDARFRTIRAQGGSGPVKYLQVCDHSVPSSYADNESSLYIPQLPLIFVLALSSPPEPSYLHSAYPRAALALLRVHKITVTSQVEVIEQLLSKVCPVFQTFQLNLTDQDVFRPCVRPWDNAWACCSRIFARPLYAAQQVNRCSDHHPPGKFLFN